MITTFKVNAAAPEMLNLLREAVMHMEFSIHHGRSLTSEEQEWLEKARRLLDVIEEEE